jgi:choline-sulfatase
MWYKKSFYDQSARIPLIISAPWIAPQRIGELVSLVDLLPTFMGIASAGDWSGPVERLEGTDLLQIIGAPPPESTRTVYAEYLAESISAPIFMIRRKNWKFICSSQDPNLLYDLEADPNEMNNLAAEVEYRDLIRSFEEETRAKWDVKALTERVLLSQRRRRLISDAMQQGAPISWNHGERRMDETPWYRGGGAYNEWALTHLATDGSLVQPGPVLPKAD